MRYTLMALVKTFILATIIALGFSSKLMAATDGVVNYQVLDRSQGVRHANIQRGLNELIVRLTGVREITEYAVVRELLRYPEKFVQQYHYSSEQSNTVTETIIQIQISFDVEAVRAILQSKNVPLWLGERPKVLVWMAVDEVDDRYILSNSSGDRVRALIERAARARGISLWFPLLDLQDQSQIQYMDVWGGFFDYIKQASTRYSADIILAGKLQKDALDHDWLGGPWQMQIGPEYFRIEGGKGGLELVLQQVINVLVDRLRMKSVGVVVDLADEMLNITVEGVHGLSDYVRVINYLEGLTVVKKLHVNGLLGDRLKLLLKLEGGVHYLEKGIALDSVLNVIPMQSESWYQLQP